MAKKINLRKAIYVLILFSLVFATGCGATLQPTASPTATQESPTPVPTFTLVPTPTPLTATLPQYPEGGLVDQKLWHEIQQSEFIQGQYNLWQAWIYYWSNAQTPLITSDTPRQFDLSFDPWNLPKDGNDNLQEKVAVMLRWTDANGIEHFSYFPRNTINPEVGKYQVAPDVTGREGSYKISDWFGVEPIDVTDGPNGLKLVWRGDDYVRVDPVSGLVREIINKEGKWVPAYGIETRKPETYTQAEVDLMNDAPTVNKDGMPLEKGYATGPFFTEMFYFGPGDEVKAIYDKETGQVHPAMIWGEKNDMLVINYRSDFTYSLNPNMKDESPAQIMKVIPDYFRARACAKNTNIEIPTDIDAILGDATVQGLVDSGCQTYSYVEGVRQNFNFAPHVPIVIRIVDQKELGMDLQSVQGGLYRGNKNEIDNHGRFIMTNLREKGVSTTDSIHIKQLVIFHGDSGCFCYFKTHQEGYLILCLENIY